MSHHRVVFAVLAALFTAGISSAASAGCCGWGVAAAPVAYAPVTYASAGCGGCGTPTAAVVYAQPVAPLPAPVAYGGWGNGCGHCGGWGNGCGHCGGGFLNYAPAVEAIAVAPAPIYVVNQGPDYTGPGIMTPFHTWTPSASYVVPGSYPYRAGYGYGYRGYGYAHRPVYWRHYGYGVRYGYGAGARFGVRYGVGVRGGVGLRGGYVGARHVVYRGGVYGRPMMRRVYR
jgi:hypothetical protein